MNIIGVNYESFCDGQGIRTVLFVAGCTKNCKGCQNPTSHNFNAGNELNKEVLSEIFNNISERPYIQGLTLSGGDPLEALNRQGSIYIIESFKQAFPNKDVWIYTGEMWEDIKEDFGEEWLLKYVDVIVDGKFDISKRTTKSAFKGSTNQRIIDVKMTLLNPKQEVKIFE